MGRLMEPFPRGTRVHHRGAIYSLSSDPETSGGWGEVRGAFPQHDGTFEYLVYSRYQLGGERWPSEAPWRGGVATFWGSHHIDEWVPRGGGLDTNLREWFLKCLDGDLRAADRFQDIPGAAALGLQGYTIYRWWRGPGCPERRPDCVCDEWDCRCLTHGLGS